MEEIPKPSSSDTGIRAAGYETELGPDSGWLAQDWTSDACREADLCPTCNACPNKGMYAFFGYDSWRGIQDDGWGNNGLHAGLNFGTRLGPISDWTGVGFQIGGSVGVYNWNGTDFHLSHNDESTPQGFVTYGFEVSIAESHVGKSYRVRLGVWNPEAKTRLRKVNWSIT